MDIQLPSFISVKKFVSRLPFRLRLCGAIFFFVVGWSLFCYTTASSYFRLQSLSQEVALLVSKERLIEKQKTVQQLIDKQTAAAPPNYVPHVLEALPLLEKEKESLAALVHHFPTSAPVYDRLIFLQSGHNRVRFDGGRMQMDGADLRNLLEMVEGSRYDATSGKPFLLIKRFDLLKCAGETYSIQVELK